MCVLSIIGGLVLSVSNIGVWIICGEMEFVEPFARFHFVSLNVKTFFGIELKNFSPNFEFEVNVLFEKVCLKLTCMRDFFDPCRSVWGLCFWYPK